MISRPLPRVRDGDVLSLELVNQMIGRVEYAADLLRRGKGIAGDQISLQESAIGTSVNYSRSESQYRILADYFVSSPGQSIIFDPFANTVFNFPPLYSPSGIDGQDVVGFLIGTQNSFYYNGVDYRIISHPQASRTYAIKIRNKIACGYYEYPNPPSVERYLGFKYNVQTNQYSNISWSAFENTHAYGIYNDKLVGIAYDDFGPQAFAWYFNGSSFQNITSMIGGVAPEPLDIYGDYIVGSTFISGRETAFVLNIKTNIVFYPQKFPNRNTMEFNGIYKNICVGIARNIPGAGSDIPVQYDISTNELSQIVVPTPIPIRRAFGIG